MPDECNSDAEIDITGLGAEGDGAAASAAGSIYVPRALPGERMRAAVDGNWVLAGPASPARRPAPLCPHFPACGGCTVQHMGDDIYRRWKAGLLASAFAKAGLDVSPEPMISVPAGSRRRAALSARRAGGRIVLGFHALASDEVVRVTDCAVLAPSIVAALPLLARVADIAAPRPDGEARLSVLATQGGLDVALSAGRRTDGGVAAEFGRLPLAGRIARLTWNGEPVIERARPEIAMSGVAVIPPPAAFLQATAEAEAAMVHIIAEALPSRAKRAADLFAGLGTFAFAIAARVQVEAFEGDRRLVAAMEEALRKASRLKPVTGKARDLFRDPLSPRELERFDLVVLDPPRAGAKAQAEAIAASRLTRVVALSCNPATLARDAAILVAAGFRIERLVPIDQFLFTPHLEAAAVLRR